MTDRARASPGSAIVGRDARRLEQQPFANTVARHENLARLHAAHHLGRDRDAGDDDVGALGVEAGQGAPLVGRHRGERVENVLEVGARDVRGVHRARGEDSLPRRDGCPRGS